MTEQFNAEFLGHVHTTTAPLYRNLGVGSNASFLAARRVCACVACRWAGMRCWDWILLSAQSSCMAWPPTGSRLANDATLTCVSCGIIPGCCGTHCELCGLQQFLSVDCVEMAELRFDMLGGWASWPDYWDELCGPARLFALRHRSGLCLSMHLQ